MKQVASNLVRLDEAQTRRFAYGGMNCLTAKQEAALRLVVCCGMSQDRAARALDVSRPTITIRLVHARAKVMEHANGNADRAQAILEAALGPVASPRIRRFLRSCRPEPVAA